ncbi:MAG TPA: hypothetical protein VGK87_03690 [Anaerolineae bacterium]|jgi:hypothetical protein
MDFQVLFNTVIASLVTSTVIAGGITTAAYLIFKGKVDSYFAKDLETYKNELQRQIFIYQTKFVDLHQKEVEVIGRVYELLADAETKLQELVQVFRFAGSPQEKDLVGPAQVAANEFLDYYDKHKLYLDDEVCQKLDDIASQVRSAFYSFGSTRLPLQGEQMMKAWTEATNSVHMDLPASQKALRQQLRKILNP